jgi:hypothetical protein
MRTFFALLITGILAVSPLKMIAGELPFPSPIDQGASNYFEELEKTLDTVSSLTNNHQEVVFRCLCFCKNLHTTYCAGEGMIDRDIIQILKGVQFAALKHQYQTRKDPQQTPYIIHPIGVANHLLMVGKVRDPDILIGALLHDTVEDTETTFEEIQLAFGSRVEGFVREVTDDKSLPKEERKALQILHAPDKSAGAAQIKLGDKFYNLSDLLQSPPPDWDDERIGAYFDWAEKVVRALPWVNAPLFEAVEEKIREFQTKSLM